MKFIEIVKKHKFLWLSITLFLVVGFTSFQVQPYQGRTIIDPKPLDTIHPIWDEHAPVLLSLAAIYAPMDTQESWSRMVCAGMTAQASESPIHPPFQQAEQQTPLQLSCQ